METIRIPNLAAEAPVSLTDVIVAAPLVSRLLLRASPAGRLVQGAALGLYGASVATDWVLRLGVRKIDFLATFGADVKHLKATPTEVREREAVELGQRLNDGFVRVERSRGETAVAADRHLTGFIAGITGQRVLTSTAVRDFNLGQLLVPFAVGSCDILSGDVAVYKSTGVFEPHVIAHEFCHRKGYFKELEAQALAYLALSRSGEPDLVQAAQAERLYRNLRVLDGGDPVVYEEWLDRIGLRPELRADFERVRPPAENRLGPFARAMRTVYEERMKLTGQNGLSDYDRGFTDFLYTYETGGLEVGGRR